MLGNRRVRWPLASSLALGWLASLRLACGWLAARWLSGGCWLAAWPVWLLAGEFVVVVAELAAAWLKSGPIWVVLWTAAGDRVRHRFPAVASPSGRWARSVGQRRALALLSGALPRPLCGVALFGLSTEVYGTFGLCLQWDFRGPVRVHHPVVWWSCCLCGPHHRVVWWYCRLCGPDYLVAWLSCRFCGTDHWVRRFSSFLYFLYSLFVFSLFSSV